MSTRRIADVLGRAGLACLLLCLSSLATVTRAADPGTAAAGQDAAQSAPASVGAATGAAQTGPAATDTARAATTTPGTTTPTATATATATAQHHTGAARGTVGARAATSARAASSAPASAADSIQLGTTEISGNRELPKLLYIVPWQRAQIGKFPGRPPNSLVDEALTPVDRAVFGRQNRYYAALESSTESARSQSGTAPTPAAGGSPRDEK